MRGCTKVNKDGNALNAADVCHDIDELHGKDFNACMKVQKEFFEGDFDGDATNGISGWCQLACALSYRCWERCRESKNMT